MSKFFAILSLSVLLGLIAIAPSNSTRAQSDGTPPATPQVIQVTSDLTIEPKHSEETVATPPIDIKIDQPVLAGKTDPKIDAFNKAVADLVKKTIDGFKDDVTKTEAGTKPDPSLPGSFIQLTYTLITVNSGLISIQFDVFYYYTGAAHPGSYSDSINYDLKAGIVLTLADLFAPDAKYLDVISAYCIKSLKDADRLDFPEGADPKPENYRSWTITENGLRIVFDAYQVAPYAAGPQLCAVPYATLKPIINPSGVLAQFVK